ncbi:MAG: hypothetical protein U0414_21065 [Polyangiaceae bacterium]
MSAKETVREIDYAALVESNRFVGREFLLWLWFESELFETNLSPSEGTPFALWLETQLTLASDTEETRVKATSPGATPEAKKALVQGKLPKDARIRAVLDEYEYAWAFKADDLALSGLKVPAQLKADDDKYEALYERMRLVEGVEAQLEALYRDFLKLRMDDAAWSAGVVPALQRWARGKPVDEAAYRSLKARALGKKKALKDARASLDRA